jgi:putative transposase
MEVRAAVQKVALEHRRRYGYRRVTAELRRQGMAVNHKRVARILREDPLLALRQKPWVATTESGHSLPVYVNLARRREWSGPDQLWVADITYIRLRQEFVDLAVGVDAFSRRAVGWALDRTLQTRLTLQALEMAVAERQPAPGVVHHSDQGAQYAAAEYGARLVQYQMTASMSRPGNPFDNVQGESFIKTLKQEEIDGRKYPDLEDLRSHVREFIEEYYNCRRLHSALGYRSPAEFEAAGRTRLPRTESAAVVKLSFQGMGRSINPISERPGPAVSARGPAGPAPPAHRTDESPADYSSASCSPAELASASSAGLDADLKE